MSSTASRFLTDRGHKIESQAYRKADASLPHPQSLAGFRPLRLGYEYPVRRRYPLLRC
ncbi:Uncharacterised protein [Vibrio cholerae]|nr:Uncharacterised protein [Vibrio cholerae]